MELRPNVKSYWGQIQYWVMVICIPFAQNILEFLNKLLAELALSVSQAQIRGSIGGVSPLLGI